MITISLGDRFNLIMVKIYRIQTLFLAGKFFPLKSVPQLIYALKLKRAKQKRFISNLFCTSTIQRMRPKNAKSAFLLGQIPWIFHVFSLDELWPVASRKSIKKFAINQGIHIFTFCVLKFPFVGPECQNKTKTKQSIIF